MAPVILGLLWLLEQYLEHAGDQPLQGLEVLANTLNALVNNLSVLAEMLYEWAKSIGLLRLLSWIPNLRPALFVAIIGGVALVVIALIALSMRIAKSRNGFEERNWLVNRKDLLRLIREAMENRLKRFAEGLANIVNLSQGRRLLAAARIRRVYVQMTNMAADLGHPRLEAQTPLEFLDTLGQLFPLAKMEARTITEAYLKVRYGELPETQGEVDQVEEAWQLVQKAGSEYLEK
jgi:hypothetical protein